MRLRLSYCSALALVLAAPGVAAVSANDTTQPLPAEQGGAANGGEADETPLRGFYQIKVDDDVEVGLIVERLQLEPALVRDKTFYYYGDEKINGRLRGFGYKVQPADADRVLARVVVVEAGKGEKSLAEAGVRILLREDNRWIIRATRQQLRSLEQLDYRVRDLGKRRCGRGVQVRVDSREEIRKIAPLMSDIYYAASPAEKGFVVNGLAWDDMIDKLRERGYEVKVIQANREAPQ